LLDVRGTLGDLFEDDADIGGTQLTLGDDPRESHTLSQVLHSLREAVEEHREADSFLAQDLRSFVRMLDILAQDYDVALMNPPYGSQNRMPDTVQEYAGRHYKYKEEFYINFFEICDKVSKSKGRIGMLVPRTFMFRRTFEDFRSDFIGERGSFDFLTEFGYGILDNATVATAGLVVRSDTDTEQSGSFIRLTDVETKAKEETFNCEVLCGEESDIRRLFEVSMSEFSLIPGSPLSYSIPSEIRDLHDTDLRIYPEGAGLSGQRGVCRAAQGLATGNNSRFLEYHWASNGGSLPYAKGGTDAWILPQMYLTVNWGEEGKEIKRYSGSVVRNEDLYQKPGLTWTYVKRTGRRFGLLPNGSIFDQKGPLLYSEEVSRWTLMSALNSSLYHTLFLSLTPEREWNISDVGRVPWLKDIEGVDQLKQLSKKQYRIQSERNHHNPRSRYYIGPPLLPDRDSIEFFYNHSHLVESEGYSSSDFSGSSAKKSITASAQAANRRELQRLQQLEDIDDDIDRHIYDAVNISEEVRKYVHQEIFLRTSESPEDREVPDPESVPEVPENIDAQVKNLVHHFAMKAVREESDGLIPVHGADNQTDMLDRIVELFEDAYGEYAEERLVEVDDILGAEAATEEAYPNLRAFIEDDLFDYHVDRLENTPIVWKLTTERLLADSTGEGFACFLDYHSIDSGLFDRLANQYLEPRKADLRERRSAANRRRSDDSLSASEQAEAAEQYERCASGLDQISVFEDVLQELGSVDERDFSQEERVLFEDLAPKVAAFRGETRKRVDTLAELHERKGEAWFKDTFSNKFWETVDEWRDEWLDALEELEGACEGYAKPTDEPVEAHLADLFDYFNRRLKGSDHYSSTGILFMTYYFEREGSDLLNDDGQPHDHLTEEESRLASLAMGLDDSSIVDKEYLEAVADDEGLDSVDDLPLAEFKALAEEIDDRCQAVDKRIPSDWSDRALSEITTAGYQPNHKHGVEINITPLADAEIVPKTVDDDVM
jgi:hypothetical protein